MQSSQTRTSRVDSYRMSACRLPNKKYGGVGLDLGFYLHLHSSHSSSVANPLIVQPL
jgi:hypothetical protein